MEEENKTDATAGGENSTTGAENQSMSFEDLLNSNKEYRKEFDRRMSKTVETTTNNVNKNWETKLSEDKTEAEKLSAMNETEKLQYQLQKERKQKEDALAETNAFKLKEQAIKVASDKGLDVSLLNYFNFKTIKAEELNVKIDEIASAFNKAVEKVVNEKLREDTPVTKAASAIENKKISRASY